MNYSGLIYHLGRGRCRDTSLKMCARLAMKVPNCPVSSSASSCKRMCSAVVARCDGVASVDNRKSKVNFIVLHWLITFVRRRFLKIPR